MEATEDSHNFFKLFFDFLKLFLLKTDLELAVAEDDNIVRRKLLSIHKVLEGCIPCSLEKHIIVEGIMN